jgi:lipopolysaccharide export system protein LptA
MPLRVYRLRRWLAATAVLFTLVVAGMYVYARLRQHSVLKQVPGKIGIEIKKTATGFQFSKSDGGRTLFTIQASDLKEFKLNGRAELHSVSIIVYGRDSSRFDQIYGDDFAYDPKSGDVSATGEVQIDLEANPAGVSSPDQAAPKALKNAIHLKTRDLVFNRETGNASTDARVEFQTPQATGWAVGVRYAGKANTLTLASQIHLSITGANAAVIQAARGVITNEPRQIVLDRPRLERNGGTLQTDQATFFLDADHNVERVQAVGNVTADAREGELHARADDAELLLGPQNRLRTATLTGNVRAERSDGQAMRGTAGRVVLDFAGENQLQKIHAEEGVRLAEAAANARDSKPGNSRPQDFDLTAPTIDLFMTEGRFLDHAVTSGAAQIMFYPAQSPNGGAETLPAQRTVATAKQFAAKFSKTSEGRSRLASIHGAPEAKIVSVNPGQPDRVSTSQAVDASFLPQGGIESIVQQGSVAYTDGQSPEKRTQAGADRAQYTPADQMLTLAGSPRVTAGGMATTAKMIRINRGTGEATAEGDVKGTYSELKEQPNGALLSSSSPIHVTAAKMTSKNSPAVALYSGNARLWQDANVIEAPTIQFDRDRRFVTAQGTQAHLVSTTVFQPEKQDPATMNKSGQNQRGGPIAITGTQLTYDDAERKAHYEGGVVAKSTDFTATANVIDAFLMPRSKTTATQPLAGSGQLDRMVAQGHVVIQQPNRRAEGEQLTYTSAEEKFVLTGGPPSIFSAEQGKITGVSLTFFRRDARVLVEGEASTPVVTQTRVAR